MMFVLEKYAWPHVMTSYPVTLAVKKDDKDKLFNKIYCNFQKLYFRLIVACT